MTSDVLRNKSRNAKEHVSSLRVICTVYGLTSHMKRDVSMLDVSVLITISFQVGLLTMDFVTLVDVELSSTSSSQRPK